MAGAASTNNRDDPTSYDSFDAFVAGASSPWSLSALSESWNRAHPEAPVLAQGDSAAPNQAPITPNSCGMTRVFAALQLVGGGIELIVGGGALLAPEPTVTKVIGVVALTHGADTLQSSIRTIATCNRTATFTQIGASKVAVKFGASPQTAERIGVVTDIGIGVGGTFAVGALSRVGPGAARLVHLTNADAAEAIRGSQMLGLGRSTIYAGPESLANARGWSILARTGLNPAKATEAILLPSEAGESFLVATPIGPFSAWQRINGTVFSAGAGTFNLTTGVFTRTGAAVNQIAIYGIDTAIMATIRAMPATMGPKN
jgi:hypothetical protein